MPKTDKGPKRKNVTPKVLAEYLSVTESWVRDHSTGRRKPTLPHIRIGDQRKLRRFDLDEIDAFLREHTRNGAE